MIRKTRRMNYLYLRNLEKVMAFANVSYNSSHVKGNTKIHITKMQTENWPKKPVY